MKKENRCLCAFVIKVSLSKEKSSKEPKKLFLFNHILPSASALALPLYERDEANAPVSLYDNPV